MTTREPRPDAAVSLPAGIAQFARLEELSEPWCRDEFAKLESFSNSFRALFGDWATSRYTWPSDPLHHWSRIWEYPWVFERLRACCAPNARVLDVGSATTFFPFYVADVLQADAIALDPDPAHVRHFSACRRAVRRRLGLQHLPTPVQAPGDWTGFPDAHFDAVYSISVIEHIPEPRPVIREIFRVLKSGGHLILTLDVANPLDADSEGLGRESLAGFLAELERLSGVRIGNIEPEGLLTHANSPNRDVPEPPRPWRARLRPLRSVPGRALRRIAAQPAPPHRSGGPRPARPDLNLCVLAIDVRKRLE